MGYCKICGEYDCKKHTVLLGKTKEITEFSGSSPPEIFVGRWNYPNVYTGILSPTEYGNTEIMSSAEEWYARKLQIPQILDLRKQLIYGRTQNNVKRAVTDKKFLPVMQEIAMASKSVATEFKLKKAIMVNKEQDSRIPLISRAASIEKVRLTENTKVKPKVDYLVNDVDVKSNEAILELEKAGIQTSFMIKLLSAGLLGLKKNRKLVPTRWAITATDDTLSKQKLEQIRTFETISEIELFSSEYLGNHYEFLLLPSMWEFEVLEISMKNFGVWADYESFFPRKKYADSVTGAYYANRLAVCEYLMRVKKQAACIVFREIRPEYYAPLGVGILRETSRAAFIQQAKKFDTLKDVLEDIQKRLRMNLNHFKDKSIILKNYGKQTRLKDFF
ncbi:hypothetical protein J4408_00865 [Candidatus Pacearchaeota archaeon]|nr:hypothetical protein [Candidatus Pacearchaeota archaeon]